MMFRLHLILGLAPLQAKPLLLHRSPRTRRNPRLLALDKFRSSWGRASGCTRKRAGPLRTRETRSLRSKRRRGRNSAHQGWDNCCSTRGRVPRSMRKMYGLPRIQGHLALAESACECPCECPARAEVAQLRKGLPEHIRKHSQQGRDGPECEADHTSCACFVERDPAYCNNCPSLGGLNCGPCDAYCGGTEFPECEADPLSCECNQKRDPNYCGTCLGQGGEGCAECEDFCEGAAASLAKVPGPECEADETSCACFVERDPAYCNNCPSQGGLNCGPCDAYCGGTDFPECEADPLSCECNQKRDPNYCGSCLGQGGEGCAECE